MHHLVGLHACQIDFNVQNGASYLLADATSGSWSRSAIQSDSPDCDDARILRATQDRYIQSAPQESLACGLQMP
jgi:hypothetical protein